jgi:hypothetical protein
MSEDLSNPAVTEINRLHSENCADAENTLKRALRSGELLAAQKASLKHGQWLPWLEANTKINERTAQNYLRVYKNREKLKSESLADLAEAYQFLADASDRYYAVCPKCGEAHECLVLKQKPAR